MSSPLLLLLLCRSPVVSSSSLLPPTSPSAMAFVSSSFVPAAAAAAAAPHSLRASPFVARPALRVAAAPRPARAPRFVPAMVASEPASALVQTGDQFLDDCINAIRFLAIDAVENAQSGHPGMPMGMAPASYVLWKKFMNFNPKNPNFVNRDRFVLSAGHGSMLLYALLYLFGYDSVDLSDLKQFRQYLSHTPGHPENFETAGVEVTTGPLGQGVCNAVGIAMAEAHMAAVYNKPDCSIIDNYTYCIMGDGCHMEGVSGEACSLAGHFGLGKLIALYDDNHISIDGHTDISFTEDVGKRFEAYGWQVINVPNGNTDVAALEKAIAEAKACTDKPTLIKVTTIIGFGSPNKGDSHDSHGAALGADEVAATREYLGWNHEPFVIPQNVLDHYRDKVAEGAAYENAWQQTYSSYKNKYPELAAQFEKYVIKQEMPDTLEQALVDAAMDSPAKPTRQLSQLMLNTIAPLYPPFIGGSADLAGSNLTLMKGLGDFQKASPEGRNLRFGVREHGMVSICNGIYLAGYGLRPYTATFFVFTDYARGAMRLSSLSRTGVINVTTHDSIFLGEDGPTHQPIEHLASFRAMPNHYMFRPADPIETAAAYAVALQSKKTPTTMAFTRQKTCILEGGSFEGAKRGMYVLSDDSDSGTPDVIVIGTGSETELAQEAAKQLRQGGKTVRVVSAPCVDLFEEQNEAYKDSVLPDRVPKSKRLVVEAASSFGWDRYAGNFVCIDEFGISAPGKDDMKKHFGMTVENVVEKAKAL
eukprot:gb/GEZJ01000312.1/.p1 GENE.gb/GEZJ01000312.1/~~gb/GEZJ01000312.1/.p1  ORF type:complete len:758 (-),score=129.07 gb/GEZJ01000312.1/:11028-13301(-)